MRVAITGANSFIGQRLIRKYCAVGCDIIAIVRNGCPQISTLKEFPRVRVCECDMDNYANLGDMIGATDCFVHLAWDGTRGSARLDEGRQYNNFCRSMDAINSVINVGVGCIVTAGSQAEYGIKVGMISEETECQPNTAYGKYKLMLYVDALEACLKAGVAFKEPRFFSLYGPEDYENSLIISCLKNMLHNLPCELTECVQMWDYMYIDDAIDALVELCTKPCEDGAYNFASGDCRNIKSFIEEMKEITNSKSQLMYGVIPYTEAGIVSIQPDISKLQHAIDWQPKVSFSQGISNIIDIRFCEDVNNGS